QATKAIALAVAQGAEVCRLESPESIYVRYPIPECCYTLKKCEFKPRDLVRWLREMQEDFPMIRLELGNSDIQATGERYWTTAAQWARYTIEQSRTEAKKLSGQNLHAALDAFANYI